MLVVDRHQTTESGKDFGRAVAYGFLKHGSNDASDVVDADMEREWICKSRLTISVIASNKSPTLVANTLLEQHKL